MTPPPTCPPPPDCPLYSERLPYGEDEPLRRAILRERHPAAPGLPDLIRVEAERETAAPPSPRLLPPPLVEPLPFSILDSQKGAS